MTEENKVSNFTPDSLKSKFLTKTNTDEMKDVDSIFPQPAAVVSLNKTQFEKQQFPPFKSNGNSWGKSLDNLPPFIVKEIEQHRLISQKTPKGITIKTLDKGKDTF